MAINLEILYRVNKPSCKILSDRDFLETKEQAQKLRGLDTLGQYMGEQMPGAWGRPAPPSDTARKTIIIATMVRQQQFLVFGRLRDPKWHGGELARVLNQDLGLSGMIVQAGIKFIRVCVVIPEEVVEISGVMCPSLHELEVYNKIAWHVKNM